MSTTFAVFGIRAEAGKATRFKLSSSSTGDKLVTTSSRVIHSALVAAYIVGADITVDMEDEPSTAVQRVNAFEAGIEPRRCGGHLRIARIATQRANGIDHLEVFLAALDNGEQKQYNVYDALLQDLLTAVFHYQQRPSCRLGLDVKTQGYTIVEVSLGSAA